MISSSVGDISGVVLGKSVDDLSSLGFLSGLGEYVDNVLLLRFFLASLILYCTMINAEKDVSLQTARLISAIYKSIFYKNVVYVQRLFMKIEYFYS